MGKTNHAIKNSRVSSGPKRSIESHEAILDAAEELINEGGISLLSFESIARKAKAGKSTIYRWWPNKMALLLEMYERRKRREFEFKEYDNLRDDLKSLTKNLWSFWRKNHAGENFAALIAEAQYSADSQKILQNYFNHADTGISIQCFKKAKQRGEISELTDLMALRKAYVAMNWFHLLCGNLTDDNIEPAIDMLLNGFLIRK